MSSGSTAFPDGSTGNPQTGERYQEAPPNAHDNIDSKDQRSLKNTLAAASAANKEQQKAEGEDDARPTDAAKANGNEPSRGAKIDEMIENEEAEYLAKRGKA